MKDKVEILRRIQNGEKPGALAKEFKIPASTISTWKKYEKGIQSQAVEGVKLDRKRNRASKLPEVERALLLWFKDIRSRPGTPVVTNDMLLLKAKE